MNIILKFLEGFCVQLNWNIRELRRSKKNRATCVDRQGKCCALYECVTVVVTLLGDNLYYLHWNYLFCYLKMGNAYIYRDV